MTEGELSRLTVRPRFQLQDSALLSLASARYPKLLPTLQIWQKQIPLPSRIRQPEAGRWHRFPESYRSIVWLTEPQSSCAGSIVVKGAEPTMSDFDELVRWTARTTFRADNSLGHMPMADHLALRQHKIPGALTMREALAEAQLALELQQRHVEVYGELLPMPLPLLVHEHEQNITRRVMAASRAHLVPLAYQRIAEHFADGLAAYVYFYPGVPLRVRTHSGAQLGETDGERVARLKKLGYQAAIEGWLRTTARLFHLGYMAYSYQNEGLGACFDPGNACMDGGFVDVDSVVPIRTLTDDGAFYDALVATVLGLTRTALYLLPGVCHGETAELFARSYVLQRLSVLLASEGRPGTELDARLAPLRAPFDLAPLSRVLCSRDRDATDFLRHPPTQAVA